MSGYRVEVRGIEIGHAIPELLLKLGDLLMEQERGALGWFDALRVSRLADSWSKDPEKLRGAGFGFLELGDGSVLALLRANGLEPIVLLDSEGLYRTVADSLERFLLDWSKGNSGVGDLDDDDAKSGRKALAAWLKSQKVKAATAPTRFDFQAWLDTGNGLVEAKPEAPRPRHAPTAALQKLSPRLQALVPLLGLPANAPEALALAAEIGLKVPPATTDVDATKRVSSKKAGLTFGFTHRLLNDAYPPIQKTAKSFVPYVAEIRVDKGFKEDVLGVPWKANAEGVEKVLGPPTALREASYLKDELTIPVWSWLLDEAAQVWLVFAWDDELEVRLKVAATRMLGELAPHHVALFASWAITKNLLDESRFASHAELIARIKRREDHGAALLAKALARGLWEDHLIPNRLLRNYTYRWFYNQNGNGNFIVADLIRVFGSRVGPHGHDEPVLDEDTWAAVDRAAPMLEERFASFI